MNQSPKSREHVPQRGCPTCGKWRAIEAGSERENDPTACPHCGWPHRKGEREQPDA
jgi:hypothetical protein